MVDEMSPFLLPEPHPVKDSNVTLKMPDLLQKMQIVPSRELSHNGLPPVGGAGKASVLKSMDMGAVAPVHRQNVPEREVWQLRHVADPRNYSRS